MLLLTDVYASQRTLAGRAAPDDATAGSTLRHLEQAQGHSTTTARLADALDAAETDMQALLAGLQRVLNVDGHPVLRYDVGEGHVQLDVDLASQQFGIAVP